MSTHEVVSVDPEKVYAYIPKGGSSWTINLSWEVVTDGSKYDSSIRYKNLDPNDYWSKCIVNWYGNLDVYNHTSLAGGVWTKKFLISSQTLSIDDGTYESTKKKITFTTSFSVPEDYSSVYAVLTVANNSGKEFFYYVDASDNSRYIFLIGEYPITTSTYNRSAWDDTHPDPPSGPPDITMDSTGTSVTLRYDNIPTNIDYVVFKVIKANKSDYNNTSIVTSGTSVAVDDTSRSATYTRSLTKGDAYAFAAANRTQFAESPVRYATTDFCEYSDWLKAAPVVTTLSKNVSIKTVRQNEVLITWTSTECTLDGVVVQYAQTLNELNAESGSTYNEETIELETPINTEKRAYIGNLDIGVTHYFRVKGFINSNGAKYYTDPAKNASNVTYFTVPLGTIPDAPTVWSLQNTYQVESDSSKGFNLYAIHNSEDNSACSYFKVYAELMRYNNSTPLVILNDVVVENKKDEYGEYSKDNLEYLLKPYALRSSVSDWDNATLRWKIKTKGVLQDYGPYSNVNVVKTYRKLDVTVSASFRSSSTSGVIYPLTITASLDSAIYKQRMLAVSFEIKSTTQYTYRDPIGGDVLVLPGTLLYSSTHTLDSVAKKSVTLTPSDVHFEPNCSYVLNATVYTNAGLSASNSCDFTYNHTGTTTLNPKITQIETNEVDNDIYLKVQCRGNTGALVSNALTTIYRYNADGTYTKLNDGVANNTIVHDPHPRLDRQIYRVSATDTSSGTTEFSDENYPFNMFNATGVLIHWDESWGVTTFNVLGTGNMVTYIGQRLYLPFNVDVSETRTIDKTLISYIGREDPVSYYGTAIEKEYSITTEIPKNNVSGFDATTALEQLRKLSMYKGNVYVRTSTGLGCWATVDIDYNIDHCALTIPINIKVTPVEGGV